MADVAKELPIKKSVPSDQYVGETKNQMRDGFGVYHYKNGYFKYEGEWQAGLKHGHGRLTMGDGSYYEGQFSNGEMEGHGFRFWHHSGNEFTGQFLLGEMHGDGVMKYGSNGIVYEGEWYRNKRQGRGVLRTPDGIYVGDFYNNKRHGQGTMTYANGDTFVGNWVLDMRQGHGELTMSDGTVYEGQWRTDMFNGQGVMMHSSGVMYDGLWHNNRPVAMATKLVIVRDTEGLVMDLTQGQPFTIALECRNEEDELVPEQGRLLRISAGYKHIVAKEGSSLFDAIEDAEENPFETPFGYEAVSFPLLDQITDDLRLEPLPMADGLEQRSGTNLSTSSAAEGSPEEQPAPPQQQQQETAPSESQSIEKQSSDVVQGESTDGATCTRTTIIVSEPQAEPSSGSPLPPPISQVRTEQGRAEWTTLLLPAAPPLYRPHMLEEEEQAQLAGKKPRSKQKDPKKTPDTDDRAARAKQYGDERFAKPGEYVLMIEDSTDPPFMDVKLEPAFLLVKQSIDKRRIAKVKPVPKEKKKWDTSAFIASAVQSGISS